MPAFDMVVVGSGGGPDETNLSAYLLKPYDASWEDGIVALEAGSGLGALNRILKSNPQLFDDGGPGTSYSAAKIYSYVRCFLVTHAHLDHVASLVLSAGALAGPRKRIYATREALKDLESIFSDRIWPNLASWDEDDDDVKFLYTSLSLDAKYRLLHPTIAVRTLPLNHGANASGTYASAAFFVRHTPSAREFLFFGDVEPDALAPAPRTAAVWRAAAPLVPGTLAAIFIECSWPAGRPDALLFGHLSPAHLAAELAVLAAEVVRARRLDTRTRPVRKKQKKSPPSPDVLRGALDGLRVYVTHCKDSLDGTAAPPSRLIVQQVKDLVEAKGLGAEILAAEQGMRIEI